MAEDEETTGGVVWNFDDAESKLVFDFKVRFIKYKEVWDLENAYWTLLNMFSEIEPLFDETIKEELNEEFNKIITKRNETEKFSDLSDIEKGECFVLLNDFYRRLNNEMAEKDYCFRKKKEYVGL